MYFFTVLHKVRYHPHSKVNSIACFTLVKNLTATSFRRVLSDFCFLQPIVSDVVERPFKTNSVFYGSQLGRIWFPKGTYFSNLSQLLSLYSRPPYISDRKQCEDVVDA